VEWCLEGKLCSVKVAEWLGEIAWGRVLVPSTQAENDGQEGVWCQQSLRNFLLSLQLALPGAGAVNALGCCCCSLIPLCRNS